MKNIKDVFNILKKGINGGKDIIITGYNEKYNYILSKFEIHQLLFNSIRWTIEAIASPGDPAREKLYLEKYRDRLVDCLTVKKLLENVREERREKPRGDFIIYIKREI